MKKISRSSELLWLFGMIFVAFGVAICSKADLGVSMIAAPAFVIREAVSKVWQDFSVGMAEYLFQGLLLIILCIAVRHFSWRYLLAFATAVLYGYTLNFFLWLIGDAPYDAVWLRWVMLIVGDIVTAFGVACFFRTYMPLQVYELFVAEIASRFRLNINKVKWTFDISLLVISVVLALILFGDADTLDLSRLATSSFHSMGLGTIVDILFFVLVLFAAITSSIALTESAVSTFEDELGWDRRKSTVLAGAIMLILGTLSSLGYGPLASVKIIGMQFLDFFDFLTNSVMMPIAAIATCLLVSKVIGLKAIEEEVLLGESKFRRKAIFNFMIKYLCPIFAVIILISSVANAFGWISM